jgi:D-alanine--poly(phosphoribitol) ligase subunit 2
MSVGDRIVGILAGIVDTREVERNLDLELFDVGVLDSLKTVELMVALSEEFGIEISPAEFEREQWATPRRIVGYITSRLTA